MAATCPSQIIFPSILSGKILSWLAVFKIGKTTTELEEISFCGAVMYTRVAKESKWIMKDGEYVNSACKIAILKQRQLNAKTHEWYHKFEI